MTVRRWALACAAVVSGLIGVAGVAGGARAAPPAGNVDAISPGMIGGWARDPDFTGPIGVHIYIDGELAHDMPAAAHRPDLPFADQDHGYTWIPPLLGFGSHEVIVYAIGVDATGQPDGENIALPGSPGTIDDGCNGFAEPALTWCQGVPSYYVDRAADTEYLYNSQLRVGVNTSYGGTILELYGADHSFNLLSEHGGAAVQLSIWGYEPVGPDAWFAFGDATCDPQGYSTHAACLAAGHSVCYLWCCSGGAHVPDCSTVMSCVGWGAGAPFNPIQAQAANCGWSAPSNDADVVQTGPGWVYAQKSGPYHFTQTDAMTGLTWEVTATLHDAFVQLDYRITYAGPYSLTPHPQEIPAVFPGPGMNHTYHYYGDATPWTDPAGPVTTVTTPPDGIMFRLVNRAPYPHANFDAVLTEPWVTACDVSGSRCLTVAVLSPQYREIDAAPHPGTGYGYLTPLGGFPIEPGLDEQFTAHLFPGRHDEVIAGQTVRAWIYDLAAAAGCEAEGYPCDDGDPCTVADACVAGLCTGTPDPACGSDDAGVADAGNTDGGNPDGTLGDGALPDAQGVDGGSGDGASSGCNCRQGTPGPINLWLLLGILLWIRRSGAGGGAAN